MRFSLTSANGAVSMTDDVVLNKCAIIERCLRRLDEEYRGHEPELEMNLLRQDSIILNLQRACEAAIDLAMHLVRVHRLGLPQESREAFRLLEEKRMIDAETSTRMQAMVGFRNIAVHNYQKLSIDVVRSILDHHLADFQRFTAFALRYS